MAGSGWTDPRPMSPHLQIWKWHATMAASIMHRMTGIALYFGSFLIGAWILALAAGEEAFSVVESIVTSPFGQIVLFLWCVAVLFHFANGIRHLIWDGPKAGFTPGVASAVSIFNFVFAVVGAALVYMVAVYFS